ncbi:amidohydrolase family protein [Albimonas sp. CAU 1670]|uniref:amidohydrolase family protein n=1 Tax=Albimonas sp. CAU 1670 TaxID=3032599 RepID=UPI0023DABAF3|nr:amidohydrolase family protein [Albimonas sp. CAU 1670]MDF2235138.1 amidohydrolase family protein [Albimonas sp. CAU 1670]
MPPELPAPDLIVEAGHVLRGVDAAGAMIAQEGAAIRIEGGRIAEIGPAAEIAKGREGLPRVGGPGMVAMPGFANGHHHFGLTPLMAGVPFAPLELWLPRFRAMRQLPLRLDTLFSAIEMLESGTTCVHHIFSNLPPDREIWDETADAVLDAYDEIGMRAAFSWMIRDRNVLAYDPDDEVVGRLPSDLRTWVDAGLAASRVPVAEQMDFFARLKSRREGAAPEHVRAALAPANLHWLSDAALETIFGTASDLGAPIHMHLLETRRQRDFARERLGRGAVEHLHHLGLLGPNVTLGHGNWMSEAELDIVADCGCTICHNASSGLRLASGIAPVNALRARGAKVALGIDQSNLIDDRDMTVEMKLAWALHRGTGMFSDRPDAAAILQMASEHGAASAGFAGIAGRLEPGYAADVVLMDLARIGRPRISPRTPIAEAVLHRGSRAAVETVLVGGRVVVEGGRAICIDREAVMAEIDEILARPETEAEAETWAKVDRLVAHLEEEHRGRGFPDDPKLYRYNDLV